MFKIDRSPAYWWPVKVHTVDQAGQVAAAEFKVEFNRYTEDDLDAMSKALAAAGGGNVAWCKRVMRSFADVEADGASLQPTPEGTHALLNTAGVAAAIVAAFFESRAPAAAKK